MQDYLERRVGQDTQTCSVIDASSLEITANVAVKLRGSASCVSRPTVAVRHGE